MPPSSDDPPLRSRPSWPSWPERTRRVVVQLWPHVIAAAIALGVALWSFRPWQFDQSIMRPGGDSLAFHAWVQNIIETGWYEVGDRLSAPYVQNSHSYSMTDELVFALVGKVLAPLTGSTGSAVTWWVTLGFPAAAVAGVALARYLGISRLVSLVPGVAFALLPDHFVRATGHYALATTWVIPVGVLAAVSLVHPPRHRGRRRIAFECAVLAGCVAITLTSAYYAVFTGLLVAAAGAGAFLARRRRRDVALAGLRAGALGLPLVAAVALDRAYLASPLGYESFALTRTLADAEHYAGKITAMLLPASGHRVPYLNEVRHSYDLAFPQAAEGPALGAVAAVGFVGLVLWAVGAHWRPRALTGSPVLATLAGLTWVALFAYVVGGLGTLWALVLDGGGIRVWSRMHVFIALLALLAVGLTIDRLRSWWRPGAVLLLLPVILFDQTSPALRPDPPAARAVQDEMTRLTEEIEALAGTDAMVFQYPTITFPVQNRDPSPASAYDGFLPYLYSDSLRWSYGGLQGDPTADWQLELGRRPVDEQVILLEAAGYAGVLTDTVSLSTAPDELSALRATLGEPAATSSSGRWVYHAFDGQLAGCDADAVEVLADLAVAPPLLYGGPGIETQPGGVLVNREGEGSLRIVTLRDQGWDDVTATFTVDSAVPLRLEMPDGEVRELPAGLADVAWTGDIDQAETPIGIERTGAGPYRITGTRVQVGSDLAVARCLGAGTAPGS
ncbi:MAG: hypothetical protein JWP95_1060 [Actinotalea sp.]|nr:hypothetical protein [Actinotalea sp.]